LYFIHYAILDERMQCGSVVSYWILSLCALRLRAQLKELQCEIFSELGPKTTLDVQCIWYDRKLR